ncbi:hypothetical protein GCM10010260_62420 [Streptomyces filipinensis]|uniref:TarS/TarP linker domain-containing protein n=1 Tax=Streptomyces filipinensis TaxID=66887 RepID=A0A918IGJ9_9ACTN|nr:hypothetical protein GCM10010260_62420 [Streptomyces filipinensis]
MAPNLREALDVVERYTGPGPLPDRLPRRRLRVERAERMSGRRLPAMPDGHRLALPRETHAVVLERFDPGNAPGLRPVGATRERVPAEDAGPRQVLRATATVGLATASCGDPMHGGLWGLYVQVGLRGWTRERRLGPTPDRGLALPPGGIVAGGYGEHEERVRPRRQGRREACDSWG